MIHYQLLWFININISIYCYQLSIIIISSSSSSSSRSTSSSSSARSLVKDARTSSTTGEHVFCLVWLRKRIAVCIYILLYLMV